MGRFVYGMNASIDLKIEQVRGDDGSGEWVHLSEELHRAWQAYDDAAALIVQGRELYELMEGAWPAGRTDESLPDYMRDYGEMWTAKPKVLVSRTRTTAEYNTRIIGGDDAIAQLATLREQTSGAISVGGAALATQLLRAELLDELVIAIHPAYLGFGRPLFDDYEEPIDLKLLSHRAFETGVTMSHFEIVR